MLTPVHLTPTSRKANRALEFKLAVAKSQNAATAAKAQLGVTSAKGSGGKLMSAVTGKKKTADDTPDDGTTSVDRYQLSELVRCEYEIKITSELSADAHACVPSLHSRIRLQPCVRA